MASTIRELKVGDRCYVAYQLSRYGRASEQKRKQQYVTISKVGRKYAYFGDMRRPSRFCRDTGQSVDERDSNERSNGLGFDVYLTKELYDQFQYQSDERKRLASRLGIAYNTQKSLEKLSHDAVIAIHTILDEQGIED